MRNLVVFLHSSLDGIIEGPKGAMDIGFVKYDKDLEEFANQVTASADTILWGRNTYEMMYHYWPEMLNHPHASDHERQHAAWITNVEKLVCSTSLVTADWENTSLLKGDLVQQISQRKEGEGKDILVLGSPRLAKFLLQAGIVDYVKLTVSPVLVGNGLKLFEGITSELELVDSEILQSGVLCLTYHIRKSEK